MSKKKQATIPESWTWSTIGEVTVDRIDQSGPNGAAQFFYVDISSIDTSQKKIVAPKNLKASEAPSRARQRLKPGDVVVSMTRPNLNAVALVTSDLKETIGSTGFDVLRTEGIEPRWLFYLVQSTLFVEAMSMLVQGALYPAVRPRDIRNYRLPVAPLSEQRRIVAEIEKQFTRLDAAVAALKRVQANLKRYRAAVLKAACEGRLVPTEAELARREGRSYEPGSILLERILAQRHSEWEGEQGIKFRAARTVPKDDKWKSKYKTANPPSHSDLPRPLPEGWTWATTEQVGEVQLGRQRSPRNRSHIFGTKYIRAANITECGLNLVDVLDMEFKPHERERYRLRSGDIVLSEASGSPNQVGKPAVWRDELPLCCFQNTVIRMRPRLVRSEFLLAVFRNFYTNRVFARIAGGVGINHLGADKFSVIVIPLCPISEQDRISAEVERRLSLIEEVGSQVEANLMRAQALRNATLKRAFEGRLVPQDPNDEPANLLLERIRSTANPGCAPVTEKDIKPRRRVRIPKETVYA